ncbi:PTS lactose/cellobiose transporter subunit IIA [Paratissierella segnis]|uniref:PTS lactose/cellobiose transporter subunit IIA n=1 Tax=Paratissierella segnis TaxID=2763679 RepID=A0A926EZ40_9FIRM|nr:PTS lactose/cellobiose transporter subunit IIA [Paratissierella segnis]MBC8589039.1 PTS lactose/cellobiose transporter subunit IIA [Paratissierella segnis]
MEKKANSVEAKFNEEYIFKLISLSGDARSNIYGAFESVRDNEYEKAEKYLKRADEYIIEAHNLQTDSIQKEAQGIYMEINLLTIHAQDHLMTTLLAKDMIKYMIDMQKEINELKKNSKEK